MIEWGNMAQSIPDRPGLGHVLGTRERRDMSTETDPSLLVSEEAGGLFNRVITEDDSRESELDCSLCWKIFCEPITCPCGHTFCRTCLVAALKERHACPLCRAVTYIDAAKAPVSSVLSNLIQKYAPDLYASRVEDAPEISPDEERVVPMFVSDVVQFPGSPIFLHLFEPRYRVMAQRSLSGDRRFAIVRGDKRGNLSAHVGCIVEIRTSQVLADGRSLIEAVGVERVSVLDSWVEEASHGLILGKVKSLRDEDRDVEDLGEEATDVQTLLSEYLDKLVQNGASREDLLRWFGEVPQTPRAISLWVPSILKIGLAAKQEALESTSAKERLIMERDMLNNAITRASREGYVLAYKTTISQLFVLLGIVLALIYFGVQQHYRG